MTGQTVTCLHTNIPGHICTTLYIHIFVVHTHNITDFMNIYSNLISYGPFRVS
jgi:hypothetical protein